MTPALEEAQRLFRLALSDCDTFELLRALSQASMAAIGFHAQQSVEKAIKSVCVMRGLEVRRTHDLAALAQRLVDIGQALPVNLDDVRQLNPFAVEFRYDDEFNTSMTREALAATVYQVLAWAQQITSG